jgi:two-component system cell cycle response regulator CtrA
MTDAARIRALEDEVETLREALRQAEAMLAGGRDVVWPFELGLTPAEGRVFGALSRGLLCTKAAICAAGSRGGVLSSVEYKLADVYICKLRRKVRAYGVEFRTIWGEGWAIEREYLAQVRAWAATGRIDAVPEGDAADAPNAVVRHVAGARL